MAAAIAVLGGGVILYQVSSPSGMCGRWDNFDCVIDGDSLIVAGDTVRLFGIDAPEMRQRCRTEGRRLRWCGQDAAAALAEKIGSGEVNCRARGKNDKGIALASCYADGTDLADWLVREGHAVADREHSSAYIEAETQARADRKGLWSNTFIMPTKWRGGKRL